jgi:hypothetical protein
MPSWLIQILVTIAIKVGIPYLAKLIPGIPQSVIDVIEQLLSDLQDPKKSNSASKKRALKRIKEVHRGVGSPPDTLEV